MRQSREVQQTQMVKGSTTRRLDLLSGWSDFVSEDAENQVCASMDAKEISDIYQEAAQIEPGAHENTQIILSDPNVALSHHRVGIAGDSGSFLVVSRKGLSVCYGG